MGLSKMGLVGSLYPLYVANDTIYGGVLRICTPYMCKVCAFVPRILTASSLVEASIVKEILTGSAELGY